MRRVSVPIKGAIPGDPRTGQSYFTKPGTVMDKVAKQLRKYRTGQAYSGSLGTFPMASAELGA
jgi:hypothetical protein